MSWSQWQQPPAPVPAVIPTATGAASSLINPAPAVIPPTYTPEQWAQLQQQNWQQWAQWQQQYQQWHQQYGAEYQKSMNALTQQQTTGLPNMAVPPPLPAAEIKPPPPNEPPPPPPPGPPAQTPSYTTGPSPSYSTPPPKGNWQPSQGQKRRFDSGGSASGSTDFSNKKLQGRHGNQERLDNQPRYDSQTQFDNNKFRYDTNQPRFDNSQAKQDKFDSSQGRLDPNSQANLRNQNRIDNQQNINNSTKFDNQSNNPEELSEAEKKFDKQFAEWEAQFQKWKEQNAEHPDKEQYKEYEKKWEKWRAQLLERREQMKKRRLENKKNQSLPSTSKGSTPAQPQPPSTKKPLLPTPAESYSKPPPHMNDEPLSFKGDAQDFLKPAVGGGIPGLDLVKDEVPRKVEDDVVIVENSEISERNKGPDFEAISKGIKSILGDQKLMNMLSMVSSQQQNSGNDVLTNTVSKIKDTNDRSNLGHDDHSNHSFDRQRDFINNNDDQTRLSFTQSDQFESVNFKNEKVTTPGRFYEPESRFGGPENRFGASENRFAGSEGRFGGPENRFGGTENRFGVSEVRFGGFDERSGGSERFPGPNGPSGNFSDRGRGFGAPFDKAGSGNNYNKHHSDDRYSNDRFAFGERFQGSNDRFQGPNDRFQGPNDRFQDPVDRFQDPVDRFQGPVGRFQGPNDRFQGPNDRFQGSNDRFQGSNDRFQGPNDRFQDPVDRFQGSNDRFQGTNDRFQDPLDRFQDPIDRFQGPNDRYQGGNDRFVQRNDRFGPEKTYEGPDERYPNDNSRFQEGNDRFHDFDERFQDPISGGQGLDRFDQNERFMEPDGGRHHRNAGDKFHNLNEPIDDEEANRFSTLDQDDRIQNENKELPSVEDNNENIPPPEDDIWKPNVVTDYEHKSLKPSEPEILVEPIYMFDYRHKPLSRIPLPQRPKWLVETVKNIREFDPPLVRPFENLRQSVYPAVRRDEWRTKEWRHREDWREREEWRDREEWRRDREREEWRDRREREDYRREKDDYRREGYESWSDEKGWREREEKERREKDERRDKDDYRQDEWREKSAHRKEEWRDNDDKGVDRHLDKKDPKDISQKLSSATQKNVTMIDDLLCPPGRYSRPPRIVIILRGPPGSGKTFLAKLIKDKEMENGGSAPRILSLDDYFMVEHEKEVTEDGKKVKIKEMVYEYEAEMEENYRNSLVKSFKKTITDGYFSFIIVDNVNEKIKYFGEMWSFAKQNGFQVYVSQMDLDVQLCTKRNIHGRSEADIEKCIADWEPTPAHHPVLDASSLIQSDAIPEVEMEEVNSPENLSDDDDEEDEEGKEDQVRSKWDNFDCSVVNLAKLDGVNKPLRTSRTMEEYLRLDTDWTPAKPIKAGQKRVRWADLEEQKQQEKMRAIGFVVGQTDWDRMMDPSKGSSALTQTKYIERSGRY